MHHEGHEEHEGFFKRVGGFILGVLRVLRGYYQTLGKDTPRSTRRARRGFLHGVRLSRVPGVEVMHAISRLSARKGYRIFIYGAKEEVSRIACERLQILYPGIHIVGRENGYLPAEKMPGLIDRINASGAEVLFLALGSPKQERWLSEHRDNLKTVRVCQGIGGTLDTIAGTVKRAPDVWCRLNGEWLYRLICEPQRVRRQMVLPVFAFLVFWSWVLKSQNG